MLRRAVLFCAVLSCAGVALGQLRIVSLNASNSSSSTAGPRSGMATILQAIGAEPSFDPTQMTNGAGIVRPIDVLCLQEAHGSATTGAQYAALLNSIYATNRYAAGTLDGASTGSGTQVVVYNTAAVQLIESAAVGAASTAGQPRQTMLHRLRLVGYGPAASLAIFNGHWKAGNAAGDEARRLTEAQAIRARIGPANDAIVLGDLNVYRNTDQAYQHLFAAGQSQVRDPINRPGGWHANADFKSVHTQSPFNPALGTGFGGAGGGVDDRFDQQLASPGLLDGEGVAYISGSYHAFGNNGSHVTGSPIDSGTGASSAVLQQLAGIIDHLPVIADYQLPAKMTVSTAGIPRRVIQGNILRHSFTVRNTAPVTRTNAADELDYAFAGTGILVGSGAGVAYAAAELANEHELTIDARSPGTKTGTLSIVSDSEAATDPVFSEVITIEVLRHARPSFERQTEQTTAAVDFGIYAADSMAGVAATRTFNVFNRPDLGGPSASLELDGFITNPSRPRHAITQDGASLIPAGAGGAFTLTLPLDQPIGDYSTSLLMEFSDEDLPNQIAFNMALNVTARLALGGDATLNDRVDISDFSILAANFNRPGGWQLGDFNRSGTVEISDLAVLAANFNTTASAARSVPEPWTAMPLLALLYWFLMRRRNRFSRVINGSC